MFNFEGYVFLKFWPLVAEASIFQLKFRIYVNVYLDRTTNSSQYTKKVAGDAYDIGAYDFESIMHYGSFYFASGDQPVMTKKDGSIIEPNRRALTDCDVYGAEELHFNSSAYN